MVERLRDHQGWFRLRAPKIPALDDRVLDEVAPETQATSDRASDTGSLPR